MTSRIAASSVDVGTELPAQSFELRRVDLVKYAGASGDFNVIHWNERVATEVGLPNVIAAGRVPYQDVPQREPAYLSTKDAPQRRRR